MPSSLTTPGTPEVGTLDRKLQHLRRIGSLLDNAYTIPGTRFRFGIDTVVGLVPGLGDIAGAAFSLYIIAQAARLGATREVLARMGWNVAVDTLVGEVPVLGDLFDMGWKANVRNVALLEQHLERPVASQRSTRGFVVLIGAGLLLLTAGAIVVAVLVLRFIDGLLRHGVAR